MKNELTKEEKAALIPLIERSLETGKQWSADLLHHPAGAIIDAILEIEGVEKRESEESDNGEGFSTNGWQYDWWQEFTYKGKNYTLSGSGYYGGHSFHLSDDN